MSTGNTVAVLISLHIVSDVRTMPQAPPSLVILSETSNDTIDYDLGTKWGPLPMQGEHSTFQSNLNRQVTSGATGATG